MREIEKDFNEENKALFIEGYLGDAKRPYSANTGGLVIGNDVWIGAHTFINCSKVSGIGDGAVIGAGAVVLVDVPPYAVVVGVPAKIKRFRYPPEVIETLQRVKWWDWSAQDINKNAKALLSPELFMKTFGRQLKNDEGM